MLTFKNQLNSRLIAITVLVVLFSASTHSFAGSSLPAGTAPAATQPAKAPGSISSEAMSSSTVNQLSSTEPQQSALTTATTPATTTVAPSNSNFSFTVTPQADGSQNITLNNLKNGEMSLITTVPPPAANTTVTIGSLDVNPDGTMAVLNIKRDSPYGPPGSGHTGDVLVYSISEKAIKQTIQGQVSAIYGSSTPYVFMAESALFSITSDICNGTTCVHSESGRIIGYDFTVLQTSTLLLSDGVFLTPQKDKLVVGVSSRGNISILTYDLAKKTATSSPLANYGFAGIKGISPDGKTAIVASISNIVFIVPVGINAPSEIVKIPVPPGQSTTDYALASVTFDSTGTKATLTAKNGNRYSLNLKTMSIFRCGLFKNLLQCPDEGL